MIQGKLRRLASGKKDFRCPIIEIQRNEKRTVGVSKELGVTGCIAVVDARRYAYSVYMTYSRLHDIIFGGRRPECL